MAMATKIHGEDKAVKQVIIAMQRERREQAYRDYIVEQFNRLRSQPAAQAALIKHTANNWIRK